MSWHWLAWGLCAWLVLLGLWVWLLEHRAQRNRLRNYRGPEPRPSWGEGVADE